MAYQQRQPGYSGQPAYASEPYGNPYSSTGTGNNANPYVQQANPYVAETSNPYTSAPGQYDARPPVQQQGSSRYDDGRVQGGAYEMSAMNGRSDPNRILNKCREIDGELSRVEEILAELSMLQQRHLDSADTGARSPTRQAVDACSERLLTEYGALTTAMRNIKMDKESGSPRNAATVGRMDRNIRESMQRYRQQDAQYSQKLRKQIEREYRIVKPDATEAEIREVVASSDGSAQVFSQTLLNSNRRGEAQSTLNAVNTRHQEIQKIERDMVVLAKMFDDLEALVVQQEAQVETIEQRGQEVKEHATQANVELAGAVDKARAARKKKWMCLGIAVLILIIIVVVVVVAVLVTRNNNSGR